MKGGMEAKVLFNLQSFFHGLKIWENDRKQDLGLKCQTPLDLKLEFWKQNLFQTKKFFRIKSCFRTKDFFSDQGKGSKKKIIGIFH